MKVNAEIFAEVTKIVKLIWCMHEREIYTNTHGDMRTSGFPLASVFGKSETHRVLESRSENMFESRAVYSSMGKSKMDSWF